MAIKQVSVLVENKKGSLVHVTKVLGDAGIDLRSLCVADTKDYGIMRIIASDTAKAAQLLRSEGMAASIREVVALAVPDEVGGLNGVLSLLADNDINMEYIYALITSDTTKAYVVMRVDDNAKTEALLKEAGYRLLTEEDI